MNRLKIILPDLGLIILSAALLLLSTPGFDLWPLAFISFTILIWIYERKRIKLWKAMFLLGFIYYLVGLAWIHVPLTVFGNAPLWGGYLLVFFTAIVGSLLFWVPFGYVLQRVGSPVLASLVLVALEMAKGKYFFGGMPWLNIGLTQHNNIFLLQLAGVIGEYGLSFLVVFVGFSFYYVLKKRNSNEIKLFIAMLMILFGYGAFVVTMPESKKDGYVIRMIQTGAKQEEKWSKGYRYIEEIKSRVYEGYKMEGEYDLLVLPETVFTENPFVYANIFKVVEDISYNRTILLGYDRVIEIGGVYKLYNSMAMVHNGEVVDNYDKMRLAPFGEYFPLEKYLYPLRKFFFGEGPLFSAGVKPSVFKYKDLRIAPLICYEGIFSEVWRERVLKGANLVVLVSNDSWFGESLGRVQHFATDKIHAAEYGRYLVRVTQDGISAVVDSKGRVVELLPEKEFVTADVSVYPINKQTFFAKFGYIWYVLIIMGYGLKLLADRRKRRW